MNLSRSLRKPFLAAFLFAFAKLCFAQGSFSVQKSDTKHMTQDKMVNSLVGPGVEVKHFVFNQDIGSEAYGTFHDKKKSFGIESGLLLTTGSIENAVGPNNDDDKTLQLQAEGDLDLDKLLRDTTHKTFDACVLEMEIVPLADTLAFNFVFGSEEYNEYVCSKFNDIFAFLISGEGISGAKNMALVPFTTTPVAINNVNNGNPEYANSSNPCTPSNPSFFISNDSSTNINVQYDGYTRVIEVRQGVIPNKTYYLKIAIADVSDRLLDSGVFIEGKSLVSYFKTDFVQFEYDSYALTAESKKKLDDLIAYVKEKKIKKIELSGHTDSRGEDDYNIRLSKNRADAVMQYFTSKGITRNHISIIPRGETMPISENESENGQARNRRVEVKLLGGN